MTWRAGSATMVAAGENPLRESRGNTMRTDDYGNEVWRCEDCGVDFIEGFNEELSLCDECAEDEDGN